MWNWKISVGEVDLFEALTSPGKVCGRGLLDLDLDPDSGWRLRPLSWSCWCWAEIEVGSLLLVSKEISTCLNLKKCNSKLFHYLICLKTSMSPSPPESMKRTWGILKPPFMSSLLWKWNFTSWVFHALKVNVMKTNEEILKRIDKTKQNPLILLLLSSNEMISSGFSSWSINRFVPLIVTELIIWSAIRSSFDVMFFLDFAFLSFIVFASTWQIDYLCFS